MKLQPINEAYRNAYDTDNPHLITISYSRSSSRMDAFRLNITCLFHCTQRVQFGDSRNAHLRVACPMEDLKEPPNFNLKPHFYFLVSELFTKLDVVSKDNLGSFATLTSKKQYIIDEFVKNWRHYVGSNIYPAAKLIFPSRDGRLYFMKDVGLSRLISKMYKIPKSSVDHKRVHDWKRDYHNLKKTTTDRKRLRTLSFILAQQVAERRDTQYKGDEVTIDEVNDVLDQLAGDEIDKSEHQINLLKPFIDRLSTEELQWFFRVILKDSMIAPMELYFYASWHPDAPRFSNVINNLRAVFWRLTDTTERLSEDELKIHLMYPFLPQLAAKPKLSYEELASKMGNNFYIEEKIDGDRMVMHMKRNPDIRDDIRFKYYTRRCRDYSLLYGENLEYGAISKYLRHAFHEGVNSLVLDGEMVAWDYRRNVILPFGTLKASAVQEAVRHFTTDDAFADQSAWPFYIIYDILYLNGVDLTGTKLIDRRNALRKVVKPIANRFEVLDAPICHTAQDIEDAIKKTVLERSEGVMLKNVNLKYKVAQRDNSWVKIKPEYLEQFGENLDLAVIGVIRGVKNAYICGLKDTHKGNVFKSFCTVANGFSDLEYDEIARITEGKWHSYKDDPPPADEIVFGSRKPDSWIHPRDSLVLEIKARSIDSEPTGTYAVGTTLHNLYCRTLREDKSFEECVTLQEYKEIKELSSRDATKTQEVIRENKSKRRKVGSDSVITPPKQKSTLFKGLRFMILSGKLDVVSGTRTLDQELISLVKQHGGTVSQILDAQAIAEKILVCISEVMTIKSKQMLLEGMDLIKPEWIFQCIAFMSIIPFEPSLVFKSESKTLEAICRERADPYGDSYILHVTEPIANYVQRLVTIKGEGIKKETNLVADRLDFIMKELPSVGVHDAPLLYLFEGVQFFLIFADETPSWEIEGVRRRIFLHFGCVTDDFMSASVVTILDWDQNNPKIEEEITAKADVISHRLAANWTKSTKIPYIVREAFIESCIRNHVLVDPQDFKLDHRTARSKEAMITSNT